MGFFKTIAGICASTLLSSCNDNGIIITKDVIKSKNGELYIITKNWGLTSDKQLTLITDNDKVADDLSYDSSRSYVYEGLSPFVYILRNDTLFIYSMTEYTSPEPTNFSSSIVVVQKGVKDSGYIDVLSMKEDERREYKSPGQAAIYPPVKGKPIPPPPGN